MAYSRTFSGWRYRYKYGTRSSRRWKSGNRLRALGNARAARQQRDSTTVTLNRIASFPVEIPIGTGSAGISIAHWNELRLSTYFQNYSPMYDQMKLDKIRVKVVGSQAAAAQTTSISPAVVMAFDRNGLNAGQSLNPSAIATYSSSQMKNWSLGNAFTMYQTIYPSTIMEKGQYIPTDSLTDPADDDSGTNPCTSISDPTLPFKPVTLLGVSTGANQTAIQTYVFTLELEYTVTFRGMRKPSLSSSPVLGPFADTLTSNGRYTVTAEQVGVDGWNSIDIRVNVPTGGSDVMLDRFTFWGGTNNSLTIEGPTYLFSSLTQASQDLNLQLPPGSLTFVIKPFARVVQGITVQVNMNYRPATAATANLEIPSGSYYLQVSPTFTESYYILTLASGTDPVILGPNFSISNTGLATLYVQADDISIFN